MAFLTALALGVAAASTAYGAYEKYEGNKTAKEGYKQQQQGYQIQAQAAQQAHDISVNQAASSVQAAQQNYDINVAAQQNSVAASQQSHDINARTIADQQQQQLIQKRAMETDANRQSLEIVRNQQRSRAQSLATAVGQGGQGATGSSALYGAYGQISGQSNTNLFGVQQNLAYGEGMYRLNADITQNNISMNNLQNLYAQQQAASQTALSALQYQYAQTTAKYQTQQADAQLLNSQGAGVVAQGGGKVAMGQAQQQAGNSLIGSAASIFSLGTNANNLFGGSLSNLFNFNTTYTGSTSVNNPLGGWY